MKKVLKSGVGVFFCYVFGSQKRSNHKNVVLMIEKLKGRFYEETIFDTTYFRLT